MTVSLYVYYKVAPDANLAPRVKAMQDDLRRLYGIAGRLLRRRDDPTTWMEVYEPLGDAETFEAMLEQAVTRHGLLDGLAGDGVRHLERFVAV